MPYSEMEEFRKKYAKPVLQKDNLTFLFLDDWLKMQGLINENYRA